MFRVCTSIVHHVLHAFPLVTLPDCPVEPRPCPAANPGLCRTTVTAGQLCVRLPLHIRQPSKPSPSPAESHVRHSCEILSAIRPHTSHHMQVSRCRWSDMSILLMSSLPLIGRRSRHKRAGRLGPAAQSCSLHDLTR